MTGSRGTLRSAPSDGESDAGSATVWLLLVITAVMVAAGLVVDGGRALAARQQATGLAGEAARAAVDRMDTAGYRRGGAVTAVAPGSAQAAACAWVHAARPDAGCTAQPAASGTVRVTVTVIYRPLLLSAAGIGPLIATGRGVARAAVGATQEVSTP